MGYPVCPNRIHSSGINGPWKSLFETTKSFFGDGHCLKLFLGVWESGVLGLPARRVQHLYQLSVTSALFATAVEKVRSSKIDWIWPIWIKPDLILSLCAFMWSFFFLLRSFICWNKYLSARDSRFFAKCQFNANVWHHCRATRDLEQMDKMPSWRLTLLPESFHQGRGSSEIWPPQDLSLLTNQGRQSSKVSVGVLMRKLCCSQSPSMGKLQVMLPRLRNLPTTRPNLPTGWMGR